MSSGRKKESSAPRAADAGLCLLKAAADAAATVRPRLQGVAYDQILDLVPLAVCICDASGRLVFHNRRAAELWGWASAGGASTDWFAVQTVQGDVEPLATALREGKRWHEIEMQVKRLDGTRFEASVSIEPLRRGDGQVSGAMVAATDISARKRDERHQALLTQLSERLAAATEPDAIIRAAAALVGEHLGVDRCGFVENDAAAGALKVIPGWIREGTRLPSLAGRHHLSGLGDDEWQRTLGSSRIAIADVATDPHTARFAEYYQVAMSGPTPALHSCVTEPGWRR